MAEQNSVWKWLADSRTYIAAAALVAGGLITNYVKPGIMLTHRVEALESWQEDMTDGFNEVRWGQRWVICRIEFADAQARESAREGEPAFGGGIGTNQVTGCEWIRSQAPGIFSTRVTTPLK